MITVHKLSYLKRVDLVIFPVLLTLICEVVWSSGRTLDMICRSRGLKSRSDHLAGVVS